ncbi:MAG: hypothetical protein AAB554_00965 [Patescibacteria group bacterium]
MKPLHSTILASFGGVLAALGMASAAFASLKPLGGLLFFAGTAVLVGRMAFPEERRPIRWTFGLLGASALTAVFGTVVYYAYKLDTMGLSWLLISMPWVVFAFTPLAKDKRERAAEAEIKVEKTAPEDSLSAVLLALTVLSDAAALRWLAGARTDEAIRTPWEAVPPIFFLWIGIATVCLAALAYRKRYPHLALGAASLHLFTLLAPAALVYAVGYGFDPFVHQAAERLVSAVGEITPKTPYYVGQYALVTVIAKLFRIGAESVDRYLLPVMTAVFLPAAAAWLLRRGFGVARGLALVGAMGVFLLPLGSFVSTTPQGVSNLFFLLTVIVGAAWLHAHRPPLGFVLALAAASAAAHPLAGIPALFAAALLMTVKLRHDGLALPRISKAIVFGILLGAAALAVPFAFSLREGTGSLPIEAAFKKPIATLVENVPFEGPGLETRYRPLLDFAEFIDRNYDLLWLIMAGAGAWLLGRQKPFRRSALALGGLSLALLAGSSVLRTGFTFEDVIGYEQGNYAARLYEAGLLAASPLVLAAFAWWWRALTKTDAAVRFLMALVFAAAVAALAYGAFPRLDDYRWSRGYSTSAHDVEAVRWIDTHAIGPYVVLANQSVSAAALREYGFRTYYGDQFYYSIPTGAPLYQKYLEMVYDAPSRATMDAAMRDIGVRQAYFVINDYWTDAGRIIDAAKKTADDWQEVGDGKVFIFRYTLR